MKSRLSINQSVNSVLRCPLITGSLLYSVALTLFSLSQGDYIQTCQGDRTWSGTQPVCVGRFVFVCNSVKYSFLMSAIFLKLFATQNKTDRALEIPQETQTLTCPRSLTKAR